MKSVISYANLFINVENNRIEFFCLIALYRDQLCGNNNDNFSQVTFLRVQSKTNQNINKVLTLTEQILNYFT